jgi:Flp pilus assembly pilin Flp
MRDFLYLYQYYRRRKTKRAQTFVEYTLLLGIVISVLVAMTPWVRRGVQAMVKIVADQVGNQQGAEQMGGESGHLVGTYALTQLDREKVTSERLGIRAYEYIKDETTTMSNLLVNLGFTERELHKN